MFLLLLLLVRPSWASPPDAPPPRPDEILAEHGAALGIDADTLQWIAARFEEDRPTLDALHAEVRASGGASATADELRRIERALMEDVRSVLTEDQWAAFQELAPPPRGPGPGPRPRR